ncbi:MAG: hypothetical protein IJQ20_06615 [Paludibacteraceae bacterium]|nr:hypothetical protein [Paludibacteraceae bacterium]
MSDHKHTIAEVYRLQEELENRAPKQHCHDGYSKEGHEHPQYAPKNHEHGQYAHREHQHDEYAAKKHEHKGYAPAEHKHPELEKAIKNAAGAAIVSKGAEYNIDRLRTSVMHHGVFQNTGKAVHLKDYFVSDGKVLCNSQNIIIAPKKYFAVRICRTEEASVIIFDGILNDL